MQILVEVDNYKFEAEFKSKMNIVMGNSGVGKTTLLRLLTEEYSSAVKVKLSDEFNYIVFNDISFENLIRSSIKSSTMRYPIERKPLNKKELNAASKCDYINKYLPKIYKNFENTDKFEVIYAILISLRRYWSDEPNFPFYDSLIFMDDVDFIDSLEFATLFNCDKSNIYVSINRDTLGKINYSVEDRFIFKNTGRDHYIIKEFNNV